MTTRAPALAVLGVGVLLILAGAAELWVGNKAEGVADLVRSEMTDHGLAQHRADFETARDTFDGIQSDVLPAVADSLGASPEELASVIRSDYPAVGKLIEEQDAIVPFAESALVNLENQQGNFQSADALPAPGVPGYAGGVIAVALGGILVVTTLLVSRNAGEAAPRWYVMTIVGAAAALLIVPIALRIPQKSADAQEVLDSLNPGEAVVRRTEDSIATALAADQQLRDELFPDVAAALGLSDSQLQAAIASEFPQTARGIEQLPAVLDRYQARLAIRQGGAPDLRTLKKVPIGQLGWFDPIVGIGLAAVAAWVWAGGRRPAPQSIVPRPSGAAVGEPNIESRSDHVQ